MAEAAHTHSTPFADDTAGMEYFESEAHYRVLAANIRDQLRQHGGFVLFTGNPAPNSELLARQLTVVGSPRCRAAVVKCHAQMNFANLMNSYRKLIGTTIEEAGAARPASWPPQSPSSKRGQDVDVLVLDDAECLGDEVMQELARVQGAEEGRRPALLLVAGDSMIGRLAAKPLNQANAAIVGRFDLHRLAQREAGSFIRYQLTAADLDRLDIFKPQVVELIETYADGDPAIVNGLARSILTSVPQTPPKFAGAPRASAPKQEEKSVAEIGPAATIKFPTPDQGTRAHESQVAAPSTQNVIPISEPIANPTQSNTAPQAESSPAPEFDVPSLEPASGPLQADLSLHRPADAQDVARTLGSVDGAASLAPDADAQAMTQERESVDVEGSPTPVADFQATEQEQGLVETEAASASLAENPELEPASGALEGESSPASIADSPDLEQPIGPIEVESLPTTFVDKPAIEQEHAPIELESSSALEIDIPSEAVVAIAAGHGTPKERSASASGWMKGLLRVAATFLIVAFVVVAITVLLGISYDGHTGSAYFDTYLKFARSVGLLPESTKTAANSTAASVPVPKESNVQSLRTTTDEVRKDLLFGAEPADSHTDTSVKIEEPPAAPATGSANSSAPAPQEPSRPPAPTLPSPAARAPPMADVAPPVAQVSAAPSGLARTTPAKQETAASPLPKEPAPPISGSAPSAATPAPAPVPAPLSPATRTTPAKQETAALPPPKEPTPPIAAPPATAPPSPSTRTTPAKQEAAVLSAPREPAPPSVDRRASSGDINLLLQRGDQLLAGGDIIAARHYFELVAEAGDGRAAIRLGKTYDPAFLQQSGARGIAGNPAMAKFWYLKAIASGDKDADMRLLQLMALYPE